MATSGQASSSAGGYTAISPPADAEVTGQINLSAFRRAVALSQPKRLSNDATREVLSMGGISRPLAACQKLDPTKAVRKCRRHRRAVFLGTFARRAVVQRPHTAKITAAM